MNELTLVFTARVDSRHRYENIVATLRYYAKVTNCKIIFLEANDKPVLQGIITHEFPTIQYVFVADKKEIFHRTHYINIELRQLTTKYAAVIDSDIVIPVSQLVEAYDVLVNSPDCIMVIPYDGRAINHNEYFSDMFRASSAIETLETIQGYQRLMDGFRSVGGAYVVDVAKYRQVGWENEHFIGWGPEDCERVQRLDILGYNPIRIHGVIHHLNHPRGVNSYNSDEAVAFVAKRELCKVCSMMPDQLRKYISTWSWIM